MRLSKLHTNLYIENRFCSGLSYMNVNGQVVVAVESKLESIFLEN